MLMMKTEDKYFIFDNPVKLNWKYYLKKSITFFLRFFYKFLMEIYHPVVDKKKNKVSICAIFKNEAPYMREWIEFHRIVGVDHFYMYNNFSNDAYKDVLQPYIEEDLVTLIEWPHKQAQMKCYFDCLKRFSSESEWIGFIDLDEFVVPKTRNTIYDILKPFQKNRPSVMIYWRVFGSSGKIDRNRDGLVTEDFTVCWPKYDTVGKCFLNTAYMFNYGIPENLTMHSFWGSYKGWLLPPVNIYDNPVIMGSNWFGGKSTDIQINHYFTKTYKEYIEKSSRGDAFFKKNPRNLEYFFKHEMNCQATDYSAYKYLIKLKIAIGDIK